MELKKDVCNPPPRPTPLAPPPTPPPELLRRRGDPAGAPRCEKTHGHWMHVCWWTRATAPHLRPLLSSPRPCRTGYCATQSTRWSWLAGGCRRRPSRASPSAHRVYERVRDRVWGGAGGSGVGGLWRGAPVGPLNGRDGLGRVATDRPLLTGSGSRDGWVGSGRVPNKGGALVAVAPPGWLVPAHVC
jgi:hypothetical protein